MHPVIILPLLLSSWIILPAHGLDSQLEPFPSDSNKSDPQAIIQADRARIRGLIDRAEEILRQTTNPDGGSSGIVTSRADYLEEAYAAADQLHVDCEQIGPQRDDLMARSRIKQSAYSAYGATNNGVRSRSSLSLTIKARAVAVVIRSRTLSKLT